ncbi:hypothetical protein FOE78_15615 [Microlunatus elymi]|uniref:Uncharacterized protein n=1 Tax=Microlunatus elymi TaxID=2596828 RepID=A0A516Q1A3_9ACTN|nr:hypothetical protein [Microlunatus elymi]QDP97162.1 hypothetical protein FOE78_15615 [Microlunatus elymi]
MANPSFSTPSAVPAPTGRLVLHLRAKDGIFGVPKSAQPQAEIDGRPVEVGWGRNDLQLPAGDARLELAVRNGRTVYGGAAGDLSITSGQQLDLHYSPPLWRNAAGRIGTAEQPFGGKTAMIALLASIAAVVLVVIVVLIVVTVTTFGS